MKIFNKFKGSIALNLQLILLLSIRIKFKIKALKYLLLNKKGSIVFLKNQNEDFNIQKINGEKIILFAVYSPKSQLMYERFFMLFEKLLDYKIIVISNNKLPEWFIEKYSDRVIAFGERYNIGRDFGIYKEFIQLLKRNNVELKNLVILNDSTFANLKNEESSFVEFFNSNQDKDFLGVAEYFWKPDYHVQSYFLMFSNKVLKGKNFNKFWDNFLISDDRRSNINKGEVMLTNSILKDGIKPRVYLSTDRLLNKIMEKEDNIFKLMTEMSFNRHIDQNIVNRIKDLYLRNLDEEILLENKRLNNFEIRKILSDLINVYGMIVVAPFFIVDELGFPFLKRDLVYRQITEWMEIRNLGKSFDAALLNEYVEDQRTRTRVWNLKSFKEKLMYHTGMN